MGRYLRSREVRIVAPGAILAPDFCGEASDSGQEPKKGPAKKKTSGDERTLGVATLRERQEEKRRGNDAPWKAWKTQKASFPLFPPGLEIRQTAPDFHISTAPAAGLYPQKRTKKMNPETNSS